MELTHDQMVNKIEKLSEDNRVFIQTLQEIKTIAETCCSEINCEECPFTDECNTEMEALGVCRMILKLISKAEEE